MDTVSTVAHGHDDSIARRLRAGEVVTARCSGVTDAETLRCNLRAQGVTTGHLITTWPAFDRFDPDHAMAARSPKIAAVLGVES